MTDIKPLTIKQKKFVKAYVETGNGTKAALKTYDTTDPDTARAISSENLAKPSVRFAVEQALEKHGITMDAAIKPIKDGLEAEKVSITGQGDQAFAEVTPDHSIRLKASGMALKLMGADKGEQAVPAAVHFHNHIETKKADYEF